MRLLATTTLSCSALAALALASSASSAVIPNPCTLVPAGTIASAFGAKTAPASTNSVTSNTATCLYGTKLTIEVGLTALANLATPLKSTKISGLPHGVYSTYPHTTQTQIVFFEGSAASGTYAVIRNFARIPQAKLIKIAKTVNTGLAKQGISGSGSTIISQ